MIKDIVVNLGLGAQDPAGTYAISVAEKFEAHLVGIAVSYEPVIPGTVMGGVPPDVIEGQRVESNKRANAAIARFEQAATRPSSCPDCLTDTELVFIFSSYNYNAGPASITPIRASNAHG